MDTIYRIIWHVILVQPFHIFRWITVQRLIGLEAIALFNPLTPTDRNAFYAGLLWAEQKLKEEDVKEDEKTNIVSLKKRGHPKSARTTNNRKGKSNLEPFWLCLLAIRDLKSN